MSEITGVGIFWEGRKGELGREMRPNARRRERRHHFPWGVGGRGREKIRGGSIRSRRQNKLRV
mgnify:CR=1 FL=1